MTALYRDLYRELSFTPIDAPRLRRVLVRDLVCDGDIGIHAHEMGTKQPIRVNLDVAVVDEIVTEDLTSVLCYEALVRSVEAIINEGHINLVETLAEKIAQMCLADPRALFCRIRVEKLAAIPQAASVGVEIERSRQDFRG